MFKKIAITIVTIAIILGVFGACGTYEHNYTREATVYAIVDDVVTFEDNTGHLWNWVMEEGEYFTEGETVKLKMFDNYTMSDREDDIIKKVK